MAEIAPYTPSYDQAEQADSPVPPELYTLPEIAAAQTAAVIVNQAHPDASDALFVYRRIVANMDAYLESRFGYPFSHNIPADLDFWDDVIIMITENGRVAIDEEA